MSKWLWDPVKLCKVCFWSPSVIPIYIVRHVCPISNAHAASNWMMNSAKSAINSEVAPKVSPQTTAIIQNQSGSNCALIFSFLKYTGDATKRLIKWLAHWNFSNGDFDPNNIHFLLFFIYKCAFTKIQVVSKFRFIGSL